MYNVVKSKTIRVLTPGKSKSLLTLKNPWICPGDNSDSFDARRKDREDNPSVPPRLRSTEHSEGWNVTRTWAHRKIVRLWQRECRVKLRPTSVRRAERRWERVRSQRLVWEWSGRPLGDILKPPRKTLAKRTYARTTVLWTRFQQPVNGVLGEKKTCEKKVP